MLLAFVLKRLCSSVGTQAFVLNWLRATSHQLRSSLPVSFVPLPLTMNSCDAWQVLSWRQVKLHPDDPHLDRLRQLLQLLGCSLRGHPVDVILAEANVPVLVPLGGFVSLSDVHGCAA